MSTLKRGRPRSGWEALHIAGVAVGLYVAVLALLYLLTGAGYVLLTLFSGS